MPSSSAKQKRFMAAVSHSPKFAKKAGVPQSVGKEFYKADIAEATERPSMKALTKGYTNG